MMIPDACKKCSSDFESFECQRKRIDHGCEFVNAFLARGEKEKKTETYLVIEVGCEGIDGILRGFSDPKQAVKFYEEEEKRILESKDEEYSLMDDDDVNEVVHPGRGNYWRKQRADRLCIQKVTDAEPARCVCTEVGLPQKDEMILY
jgi:hypothetical protein